MRTSWTQEMLAGLLQAAGLRLRRAGIFLILAALLLPAGVVVLAQTARDYDLDWWTVDSGGSTLSDVASSYTLGATAGQPDAGLWQGNGYALVGGFWGGAPVSYRVFLPLVLREA